MGDGALHVDRDAGRDRPVLERPDHLEAGPVADVGEARVRVAAERALEDPPVAGPVEDRAPGLELADPVRRLLGVELGHPRVVEQLAADHRVPEVDLPRVGLGDVAERRGHPALGHDGVGLAEERLADEPDVRALGRRLDRRAQAGAPGPDDEDVVGVALGDLVHSRIDGSLNSPIARSRMYRSADATARRLQPASAMWLPFRSVTRCHSVWRVRARAVHEKQSSRPPTKWRSEWQDSE